MGSAFSSKKKEKRPEPSEVDRAILSLKTQKRKLGEYQRQVQGKVVAATEHAHKCVQEKNRSKAIFHLKQKKVLEVRLGEIEQYLINVEETLCNIDTARQNNKVFDALKSGASALKDIQSKVSVSALQDLVADTEAAKEHEREVNSILQEENIDFDELEREFSELEGQVFQDELPQVPVKQKEQQQQQQEDLDLPDVPKREEEEETAAAAEEEEKPQAVLDIYIVLFNNFVIHS